MGEALAAAGLRRIEQTLADDPEAVIAWMAEHRIPEAVIKPRDSAGTDSVFFCPHAGRRPDGDGRHRRPLQLHGQLQRQGAGPAPDPGPAVHREHRVDRRRGLYRRVLDLRDRRGAGRRLDLLPTRCCWTGATRSPSGSGPMSGRCWRRSGVRHGPAHVEVFRGRGRPGADRIAAPGCRAACPARRRCRPSATTTLR